MSHQTFFIDIDEEITSIAERIRKAENKEVILVVPKRALLIQSIVNLKLLQKEAKNLKKKLSIVTQDKLGKMLIEKVGIELRQKLEDDEEAISDNPSNINNKENITNENVEDLKITKTKKRSKKMGSENFFDDSANETIKDNEKDSEKDKKILPVIENDWKEVSSQGLEDMKKDGSEEKIINRELVVDIASDIKKKRPTSMDVSVRRKKDKPVETIKSEEELEINSQPEPSFSRTERVSNIPRERIIPADFSSEDIEEEEPTVSNRDDKLESFFSGMKKNEEDESENISNGKKTGNLGKIVKVIFVIILILGIGALGYVAYIFVPKATITIATKNEQKSGEIEAAGDVQLSQLDYSRRAVPAKLVKIEEEVSKSYNSTGSKSVSNKKARGIITIYNEYSSASQPLVATTRFLSEDNKLFRLVKQTTVPGTTVENGVSKPGSIEAEVVADESGESFNIGPAKFTIPGFKDSGTEKYSKFYAKSTSSMTGGGNGNEEMTSISDHDIANAKMDINNTIQNSIKEKLKLAAGSGFIIPDDAFDIKEPTYKISNSLGEVVKNFEVTANASAQAIAFSESDLKKLASSIIAKSGSGKSDIDSKNITLEYGKSTPDFTLGKIDIRAHAESSFKRSIDIDNFKKGLLGKNNEELEAYIRNYSEIEKAEISYSPQFFNNRVPIYESRVNVVLDK